MTNHFTNEEDIQRTNKPMKEWILLIIRKIQIKPTTTWILTGMANIERHKY